MLSFFLTLEFVTCCRSLARVDGVLACPRCLPALPARAAASTPAVKGVGQTTPLHQVASLLSSRLARALPSIHVAASPRRLEGCSRAPGARNLLILSGQLKGVVEQGWMGRSPARAPASSPALTLPPVLRPSLDTFRETITPKDCTSAFSHVRSPLRIFLKGLNVQGKWSRDRVQGVGSVVQSASAAASSPALTPPSVLRPTHSL